MELTELYLSVFSDLRVVLVVILINFFFNLSILKKHLRKNLKSEYINTNARDPTELLDVRGKII